MDREDVVKAREDALRQASGFIRRRGAWETWMTTPWGSPVFWDPNMPWQELNRLSLLTGTPQEGLTTALGNATNGILEQIHPIYKLPIALKTGTKLPQRRKFRRYREAKWLTTEILDVLGVDVHGAIDVETGKHVRLVDERFSYVLENAYPIIGVSGKLIEPHVRKALGEPLSAPAERERVPFQEQREWTGVSFYPSNLEETRRYAASELATALSERTRGIYGRYRIKPK